MRCVKLTRSNLKVLSILIRTRLNSLGIEPTHYANPVTETMSSPKILASFVHSGSVSLDIFKNRDLKPSLRDCSDVESDSDEDCDDDDVVDESLGMRDDGVSQDAKFVLDMLNELSSNRVELRNNIEKCGVKVSNELVLRVLSGVRNDWEAAFTFFLWAGKQSGYSHSVREYHAMISILGKMRKFDTAWALIDEMRGISNGVSLVNPQTLLIMIRRYCQVHDVARAINTFYAYKRFKFDVGIEEFQGLLSALCRYKNVQDAEHLMFCNKGVFPFETKSFNIVLNGWCNVIGSAREAERIWKEMSKRGIRYDVVSFASMISCYSKIGNLYQVLRLYERMKEIRIEPDRKVYNAVIHALAKGRLVKEAMNLMTTMEEKGTVPNIVTYNSLIKPLCKARKIDEARIVFDKMLGHGLRPTIQTYHAFFRIVRTGDEAFALLEKMRKMGCEPSSDTYIMLIRKFCRWRQLDNVYKLWDEMSTNGISHDRSSYIVLIHGLFLNGELEATNKYYMEMKQKDLLPEPKLDAMIQTWLSNKEIATCQVKELQQSYLDSSHSCNTTKTVAKKIDRGKDFRKAAEIRKVVRDKGFSFWEQ